MIILVADHVNITDLNIVLFLNALSSGTAAMYLGEGLLSYMADVAHLFF